MGGNNEGEGTIEICNNHIWGLISDAGWNDSDAQVVCRQLGYQTQGELITIELFFYTCDRKSHKMFYNLKFQVYVKS